MSHCHKNVPNIVKLSHCLEQLYSCILNIYVKAMLNISVETAWLKIFVFDFLSACVLMCTWWLAVFSCLCQLINCTLATEEKVGSVRAIIFQLHEMSSITTPNQFQILAQGTFFKVFLLGKKISLEVPCKLSCFCIIFFSKARVSMPRQDSRS